MTLKKSQSSDPEADTLVLGLVGTDGIDRRFCGRRSIIRAAWRQPGMGKLSESVSNIRVLFLASLFFVSSGAGASPAGAFLSGADGSTPPPTAPEAWGSDTLTPTHRPGSRSTVKGGAW